MGKSYSLGRRRTLTRGWNKRDILAWARRRHTGDGNRSFLTLGTANAKLSFMAKVPGTAGNAYTVRYVNPGTASAALSIGVVGTAITVNLATNGASAITTKANDIANAINVYATPANALVQAYVPPGSDGTGVVVAVAATNLAGAV